MKINIAKISVIICLFSVFSCKKNDNTTITGPTNNHQTTNCEVATVKGGGGDGFLYYNSKYQVTGYATYDSTAKLEQDSMTFQYNSAGQLVGMNNYNPGATSPQNTGTFVYNSSGFLTQYNKYIGGTSPDSFDNYTCDAKGNILIDSNYDYSTGAPVLSEATVLTYDDNGNVTSEKVYVGGILQTTALFSYDSYTSRLNNLPLAARLLIAYPLFSNYNNAILYSVTINGSTSAASSTYSYTYNSEGLPVAMSSTLAGKTTNDKLTYNCH